MKWHRGTGLLLLIFYLTDTAYAATYSWTQATRWIESTIVDVNETVIYPERLFPNKGYDVRPHQQLRSMFPSAIVGDGNNKETSDNLWVEMVSSSQVIGNSARCAGAAPGTSPRWCACCAAGRPA